MAEQARRYTLRIEVEVRPQDDLAHFDPGTVTARAPQLGLEWVSGNDAEALQGFFDFFVALRASEGMSLIEYAKSDLLTRRRDGIRTLVLQALQDESALTSHNGD